jgi:uncharacterized protein (DUF58 family)
MGAYVELETLIHLEFRAHGYSFLPHQPIHSLLSGRHTSHVRGRGLDFEELRTYLPGDDIRTMDWHVTARMQRPFIRVFTEERDRPALIVNDQRINMFFGSRVSMKSVTAAEMTALAAWRVLRQGDRVGAFVFNDSVVDEIKPRRSRSTVLRILEKSVEQNHQLRAESPARTNSGMLNEVLRRVSRIAGHDFTILLISDFEGIDQETERLLLRLSEHNDVIAALIYDPLAAELPSDGELVVSDGELQIEIQFGRERIRKRLWDASQQHIRRVLSWQKELNIAVLPITTAEEAGSQIRHVLSHAMASRIHL